MFNRTPVRIVFAYNDLSRFTVILYLLYPAFSIILNGNIIRMPKMGIVTNAIIVR